MGSLADARTGLAGRLQTIAGLRVEKRWPNVVNTPAAIIKPQKGDVWSRTAFSSRSSIFLEVVLLLSAQDLERAQDELDKYCDTSGAKSIIAAIEGDTTLGGKAEDVLIGEWRDSGEIEAGGLMFLGAALPIEIFMTE